MGKKSSVSFICVTSEGACLPSGQVPVEPEVVTSSPPQRSGNDPRSPRAPLEHLRVGTCVFSVGLTQITKFFQRPERYSPFTCTKSVSLKPFPQEPVVANRKCDRF